MDAKPLPWFIERGADGLTPMKPDDTVGPDGRTLGEIMNSKTAKGHQSPLPDLFGQLLRSEDLTSAPGSTPAASQPVARPLPNPLPTFHELLHGADLLPKPGSLPLVARPGAQPLPSPPQATSQPSVHSHVPPQADDGWGPSLKYGPDAKPANVNREDARELICARFKCGKEFIPARKGQRFCTDTCRKLDWQERNRNATT